MFRFSPSPNYLGIDFGFKPAISLFVPKTAVKKMEEQQQNGSPFEDPGEDPCEGMCVEDTVWETDYDGSGGCQSEGATVVLDECVVGWYWYWDPHSTGDRFSVNGDDLCGCDSVFDPSPCEGFVDVEDSGFVLDVEVEGCCGQGERNSSYEGFILTVC